MLKATPCGIPTWNTTFRKQGELLFFCWPAHARYSFFCSPYFPSVLRGIKPVCTFLTIGIWHPIVIKTEYYWGTRPWIVYLVIGLAAIVAALFIENTLVSAVVGVFGASALWGIGELFEQQKRVERGWFPKNPKRQ